MESKINKVAICLSRLDNIKQWLELDTINKESVSQHSLKVAAFAAVLLEEVFDKDTLEYDYKLLNFSKDVILHAIFHDFDEALILRDLSHEVKYNKYNGEFLRNGLNSYAMYEFYRMFMPDDKLKDKPESKVEKMLHDSFFAKDNVVKSFVKFCDWLAMCMFVSRELRLGNKNINDKVRNCKTGIKIAGANLISALKQADLGTFNEEPIKYAIYLVTNLKNE